MRKQITRILIIIFSIICLGLLFYKVMAETEDYNAEKAINKFYEINVGDEITGIGEENTIGKDYEKGMIRYFCMQHKKSLSKENTSIYKVENIITVNRDVATIIDSENQSKEINLKTDEGGEAIAKFVKALSYYTENSSKLQRERLYSK